MLLVMDMIHAKAITDACMASICHSIDPRYTFR